ncbi:MAG TPA: hypothetical protein VFL93_01920 [Longimicrobiaceae bacterium]|nr:hypothetical protein [Longimicrobiaceae bacterium]
MGDGEMRRPERWLAMLRIAVGLWFLKSMRTKVAWTLVAGVLPLPAGTSARWIGFLPKRLADYAAGNPVGWYHDFLVHVAVPNAGVFAHLTMLGEVAVGLALRLFTEAAAALGFFLALNHGLASFWQSPGQEGFHLLLMASMVAFFGAHAGRVWGADGWLARRPGASSVGARSAASGRVRALFGR